MKEPLKEGLGGLHAFLYKYIVRYIALRMVIYHPVTIDGVLVRPGERTCIDRWQTIEREIRAGGARTLIDLGCSEGYFVRRSAIDCGCLAMGVDGDLRKLCLAQAAVSFEHIERAGVMYANLTPDFIELLPTYDVVLFMSVLHHMMYGRGVDYAHEFMCRLRPKIGMFMIFDMGHSNETNRRWAHLLPDMGSAPESWISEFLKSAGYTAVDKIGETDSYRGQTRRTLFRVAP
jgi:cyclopropane fatty-acyl-phospholipid synthase-like methyltransferase